MGVSKPIEQLFIIYQGKIWYLKNIIQEDLKLIIEKNIQSVGIRHLT